MAEAVLIKERGHEAGREAEVAGGLDAAGLRIELTARTGTWNDSSKGI